MTRVTQLIHDAGKYLLISVYPLPTHPTHNFTHNNGGNLETLPGWPKKLQHNRPARSAGQLNLDSEQLWRCTQRVSCPHTQHDNFLMKLSIVDKNITENFCRNMKCFVSFLVVWNSSVRHIDDIFCWKLTTTCWRDHWQRFILIRQPFLYHYSDVIMSAMASQITDVSIVYSTISSGADQRKHESSASLAFVRGIHRWPANSPHKGPVTRKMSPHDDVIMWWWSLTSDGNLGDK